MSDAAPALGVAAALIGRADMATYVRDTVRRSTRPHRGTWLIWTVLAVVVSLSQHADGGSWSVAMAVAQAVSNGLVLALAIRLIGGRRAAIRAGHGLGRTPRGSLHRYGNRHRARAFPCRHGSRPCRADARRLLR